eukprot:scaffold251780_cov31-Tisochrysis_lutea.AAC.3
MASAGIPIDNISPNAPSARLTSPARAQAWMSALWRRRVAAPLMVDQRHHRLELRAEPSHQGTNRYHWQRLRRKSPAY